MLAAIENEPENEADWQRWAFDHWDSHNRIRARILTLRGVNLPDYQVQPIALENLVPFLQNNAQMHTDMNGVMNAESADLLNVDMNDPEQRVGWFAEHYAEHFDLEQELGA
jgi:hypothetical protein